MSARSGIAVSSVNGSIANKNRRIRTHLISDSGSVFFETAIVLSLIAMILAGTINFSAKLREKSLLSESIRVAGRAAAIAQEVTVNPTINPGDGETTIQEVQLLTEFIIQQRLIEAGFRPADYEIRTDAARIRHTSSGRPAAVLRIGIRGRSGSEGFSGFVSLNSACASSVVGIDVIDGRAFAAISPLVLDQLSALPPFCE